MKRGTWIVLMIAALALAVFFGCSGPKGPEPIKITVGQGTDPVILDPPMYSDTPTHNLNLLIYDRLYELTKDGRVEPNLAMIVDGNHLEHRTRLRAELLPGHDIGVMFEPGDDDLVVLTDVLAAPALRDEVDGLGGPADEHDLVRGRRAKKAAHLFAGVLVSVG